MRVWVWLSFACVVAGCGSGNEKSATYGGGDVITGVAATSGVGGAQTSTSTTTAVGTGAGGVGGGGLGGAGGATTPCSDDVSSEPNNAIASAWKMSDDKVDDCDSDSNPISVSGTIAGASDVDWYWYEGDDGLGPCVDPGRTLVQSESGIRICKYLECKVGDEVFDCPGGTSSAQEDGRDGCCSMGDFQIPDLSCTGTLDDAANVYIRIDQPGATASTCNAYTLSVDF